MDTLQIAYKILYSLEHKEKADYMGQLVSPQKLDVPEAQPLCRTGAHHGRADQGHQPSHQRSGAP